MKSKKGFTLIEVLGIIIVLAIVAVITVPIVLNMIEKSKKEAVTDSAYGYIDSVNKLYVSKSMSNPDYEIADGYYNISDLKILGVDTNGDDPIGSSWVRIVNNEVLRGCLQFDEYKVDISSGSIGTAVKGQCRVSDPVSLATDSWQMIQMVILFNGGFVHHILVLLRLFIV